MNLNFKLFLENEEEKFDSIKVNIPMPSEVYSLSNIFQKNGGDLFAVGGAIRDYLYHIYHDPNGKFDPKDIDLATNFHPDKVIEILNTPEALKQGISTFPKGESFGVISAIINKKEMEIATFREDGEYTDGRRPDSVQYSTPARDAKRRDLTYNALFYDINKKEIRDYNLDENGNGQGLQDIKNQATRTVGKARDRFQEDKLRIPRLIRFFSRFNPGYIMQHLDQDIKDAIEEFKDLAGVSPERIAAEFDAGLKKSISPVNYLKNYEATGLLPAVFPNIQIDMSDVDQIGNVRNIKAILAWLFKNIDPKIARFELNKLKYSSEISDAVAFLIKINHFNVSQIAQLLKYRDLHKQLKDPTLQLVAKQNMEKDIMDFAKISGKETQLRHFLMYQPTVKSQDFTHLKGKAISDAMSDSEAQSYRSSLENLAGR